MTGIITSAHRTIGPPTSEGHREFMYDAVRRQISAEVAAQLADGREYVVRQAKEPICRPDWDAHLGTVMIEMWATVFLSNAEDARVGEYVVHSSIPYKPQGRKVVLAVSRTEGFGIEVEQRHFDLEHIRIEDRTIEAWRRVE